jgi:hypothetical protein
VGRVGGQRGVAVGERTGAVAEARAGVGAVGERGAEDPAVRGGAVDDAGADADVPRPVLLEQQPRRLAPQLLQRLVVEAVSGSGGHRRRVGAREIGAVGLSWFVGV